MIEKIDIKKMHHRNGPDTERAAAHKVALSVTGRRLQVLNALAGADRPATGSEVAKQSGLSILSIRPRLTELQEMNCIEDTTDRKLNDFGNTEIVWRITEKGLSYVD